MYKFAVEKLDFPLEKVYVILDRYGNTSAASAPLARVAPRGRRGQDVANRRAGAEGRSRGWRRVGEGMELSGQTDLAATIGVMVAGRWRPGIGGPRLLAWLAVAAHIVGAVLCWRAGVGERGLRRVGQSRRLVAVWFAMAGLLLLLGINRQLDLQSLLTRQARLFVKEQGWYAHKEQLQRGFIAAVALGGAFLLACLMWASRRGGRGIGIALVGSTFLIVFVVIRAASSHHVDRWLGLRLGVVSLNQALELGGILCVTLGAWLSRPRRRGSGGG
ncbi:MAG: 3-oxoacyl-[acyl-carrier-protein] synthase III C-terminal domain-containing protein [Planctomycetota bacterium]